MKHGTLLAAAIAAVLAGPPAAFAATDAEIAEMRRALEAVNQRLDTLEQQNQALEARNKDLEAKNAKLEEKSVKLEEANDRQTDQIAQARAKSGSADWASKITWRGDLRYRHEYVEPEEAVNDQTRHRI